MDKPGTVKALFSISLLDRIRHRVGLLFYHSVIRTGEDGTIWSEITMRPWCRLILEFFGFLVSLLEPIVEYILSLFKQENK